MLSIANAVVSMPGLFAIPMFPLLIDGCLSFSVCKPQINLIQKAFCRDPLKRFTIMIVIGTTNVITLKYREIGLIKMYVDADSPNARRSASPFLYQRKLISFKPFYQAFDALTISHVNEFQPRSHHQSVQHLIEWTGYFWDVNWITVTGWNVTLIPIANTIHHFQSV